MPEPSLRYAIFFKPYGVLTQFTDRAGRPTLGDYIDAPGIYPVGRLDFDSEGMLILTDDGSLAYRLTDPRFAHPRTYWVQVEGIPGDEALQQLALGVIIQGERTRPAKASRIDPPDLPDRSIPIRYRKQIPTSWLSLTLSEGRNRQVRRMTAAVGFPTLRLVRVAIGSFQWQGEPAPARWRDLTAAELQRLISKPGNPPGKKL